MRSPTRSSIRRIVAVALVSGGLVGPSFGPVQVAVALPSGFQDTVVWSGLTNPTAIRFAADGRVFVAEKSGVIKIFDSLSDPTPTSFGGLTTNVHNFWDRGLLGMALDPSLTGGSGTGAYVYVLYAYDHILGGGGGAPRWGDTCPSPPGATTDGCVISGRLSRFAVSGSAITGSEQVLIEDWCQQFPSHSAGTLLFGPDGALYASSGDGASFTLVDYGQRGGTTTPVVTGKNPCADAPNDAMTPPTAEGGALRSQAIRSGFVGGGGTSYPTLIVGDSPTSYWRLGESSGTTAVDQVGGRNGTYLNGPTLGAPGALSGDSNTAVDFDGTNDYVSVPHHASLEPAAFSIEAWVAFDSTAGNWRAIASKEGWDAGTGWLLYYLPSSSQLGFGSGGTFPPQVRTLTWSPALGQYQHVVATFTGSQGRLYINGQLASGPAAMTIANSGLPLYLGARHGNTGTGATDYFDGRIDEVAMYPYALSAAQVSAHYAARAGGGGRTVTLDGSILRVDPATGAGRAGNPFASSSDANARRIIAYGLRNPFRITFRPGTNELWVGDVGWDTWEEIDRIPDATDGVAENFGWPCYEGVGRQSGYDAANLNLCESLYAQGAGAVASPYYTYNHGAKVVATDSCPTGSSSVTGMAFYPETGGSFPAAYRGGLFFADHSRNCIWFMPKGSNGQPDPTAIQAFIQGSGNPVDLVIGPNGDLFYADFDGGAIRRVSPTGGNQPPTAVIAAVPTSGPAPLSVQFDGSGSSDPEHTVLTYDWDLDGDGAYDDATGATASRTYTSPGNVTVGLRVTDAGSATGTATQVIAVGNSPPVPVIGTPAAGTTWKVGDPISFSGSASDPQDGQLPASALSWALVIQHCPSNCHTHLVQTWPGVASGQFNAPDHEYPSYLELTLTATDSSGTQASVTRGLDPQTVGLTFQSVPSGLSLAVNAAASTTTFSRTVIVGSANTVSAASPQSLNGATYTFSSWSDGGAQTHTIVAGAAPATYTAAYQSSGFTLLPDADAYVRDKQASKNFGTATVLRVRVNQYRTYLKFVVTGLSGPPAAAKLRLWVTNSAANAGSVYAIANTTWTETGITWNNAPAITGSPLSSPGTATAGTWVEFDIGSAITGNGTYTFAISGGSNDFVDYASRESADDPQLVLTP